MLFAGVLFLPHIHAMLPLPTNIDIVFDDNHAFPCPYDCSGACLHVVHELLTNFHSLIKLRDFEYVLNDTTATHQNWMDFWTWQSYLMILLIPFRQNRNVSDAYFDSRSGGPHRTKKTLMIMMTIKYTHISFDVIRCASDITGTRFHTLLLRWPTFDERAPSSHPAAVGSTAAPAAMCLNRIVRRFHLIRLEQPRSVAFTILHTSSLFIVFHNSLSKLCCCCCFILCMSVCGWVLRTEKKSGRFNFVKNRKFICFD